MFIAQIYPARDVARVAALRRLEILDTPPTVEFDQIAWSAKTLFETSAAFVSFVDEDRQWFKARAGADMVETDRSASFCSHCIAYRNPLWIEDARDDPRVFDNPFVTGAPFIRFYAGAPIRDVDGWLLGTVCVIDTQPRAHDLRLETGLIALAGMASALLGG
ncbi:MAG: GAF domain-containing protein [Caulobacter sp.]|nr:GAF domain-containing protein [Caulobacter sp.]